MLFIFIYNKLIIVIFTKHIRNIHSIRNKALHH